MIAKVIFSSGHCSSLYIAFAVLTVCRGLDTALVAAKCIGIVINSIIIAFIHQSESLSDSDLNFALTI